MPFENQWRKRVLSAWPKTQIIRHITLEFMC